MTGSANLSKNFLLNNFYLFLLGNLKRKLITYKVYIMARSLGRKRFWFQQKRSDSTLKTGTHIANYI